MEENNWCVYMHTNKLNGKKYVGISSNVKRRWAGHGCEYSDQVFGSAIEKYGWENFSHDVLLDNLTKRQACVEEQRLIQRYKTHDRKFGYNVSLGGESGSFRSYGTQKKRMKCIYQYDMDGNFIKRHDSISSAIREITGRASVKVSNICLCCRGHRLSALGYRWFYEYLGDKIPPIDSPEERIGKAHKRKIYQYSMAGKYIRSYDGIADVEKEFGKSGVYNSLSGKTKCYMGFQWFYEYKGESVEPVKTARRIPVYQYSPTGEFIASYDNQMSAKKSIGKTILHIYDINKKKIYSDGYIWLNEYVGGKLPNEYL